MFQSFKVLDLGWEAGLQHARGAGRNDVEAEALLPARLLHLFYLAQSVLKVVFRKSIPARIRQRILICSVVKDKLTDFVSNLSDAH